MAGFAPGIDVFWVFRDIFGLYSTREKRLAVHRPGDLRQRGDRWHVPWPGYFFQGSGIQKLYRGPVVITYREHFPIRVEGNAPRMSLGCFDSEQLEAGVVEPDIAVRRCGRQATVSSECDTVTVRSTIDIIEI